VVETERLFVERLQEYDSDPRGESGLIGSRTALPAAAAVGGSDMIVAIASFKVREGADDEEVERTFERMRELVSQMPGFVSYKNYVAEDGEDLEIA
jgi:formiminotetrahydrofolate cyclodeaminase